MNKIILKYYPNRCWHKGEVFENDKWVCVINQYFKVTETEIIIYASVGGSGTGFSRGDVVRKISLVDKEFELIKE